MARCRASKLASFTRFCAFCVLHCATYASNVFILLYLVNSTASNPKLYFQPYMVVLIVVHLLVGLYCTAIAWLDADVQRLTLKLCGAVGLAFFSGILGFTQVIQVKVAWDAHKRRQQDEEDGDSGGEEDANNDKCDAGEDAKSYPLVAQSGLGAQSGFGAQSGLGAQSHSEAVSQRNSSGPRSTHSTRRPIRMVLVESTEDTQSARCCRPAPTASELSSTWVFPCKCFEGIFESAIFFSVLMSAVLDPQQNDPLNELDHKLNYSLDYAYTWMCLLTIGWSVFNFDYHLSPTIKKTADQSLRYTFLHVVFRGCETGSRIFRLFLWALAIDQCTQHSILPGLDIKVAYFLGLLADYCMCVTLIFVLSLREERRYIGLTKLKRLACSFIVGFFLLVANPCEFVDDRERRALKTAASRCSLALRSLRLLDLAVFVVFMCMGWPCKFVHTNWDVGYFARLIHKWFPRNGLAEYLASVHLGTLITFIIVTTTYYFLLIAGFQRAAFKSNLELGPAHYGGSQTCREEFESIVSENTPASSRPVFEPIAVMDVSSDGLGWAMAMGGAPSFPPPRSFSSQRQVRITKIPLTASHPSAPSAAPKALRRSASDQSMVGRNRANSACSSNLMNQSLMEQREVDPWYHDESLQFSLKRLPGLSSLLLSRGLPGRLASSLLVESRVIQSLNESLSVQDASHGSDIVVFGERVQLADFQVLNPLGKGKFGSVTKCCKSSTGEYFAMKRLVKQDYVQRPLSAEMPQRERDTLCLSGRHPNVAYLECAFETETHWILVTEFCELGSLSKYVHVHGKPGVPRDMVAKLSGHILKGLHHIHSFDIMHRDIKPANIGMGGSLDDPTAKLIDFGLAKRASAKQSSTIVGSYGYLAPEIDIARNIFGALHQAPYFYDERVDLYSVGICIFYMFVGRESKPLWTHQTFRAALTDPISSLWQCAKYLELSISGSIQLTKLRDCFALEAISKLTELDPSDRPRTARHAGRLSFFSEHDAVPASWTACSSFVPETHGSADGCTVGPVTVKRFDTERQLSRSGNSSADVLSYMAGAPPARAITG